MCNRTRWRADSEMWNPKRGKDMENTKKAAFSGRLCVGVRCGARTHDTQNHNLVLYQLN